VVIDCHLFWRQQTSFYYKDVFYSSNMLAFGSGCLHTCFSWRVVDGPNFVR